MLVLNSIFIQRTTVLEKTVNIFFLVTTITDALLHEGNVWAHDQLSIL